MRKPYRTDRTDAQWKLIKPLIPPVKPGGRPREVNTRAALAASGSCCRTTCRPRAPSPTIVSDYFAQWRDDSTGQRIVDALRRRVRTTVGKEPSPSAATSDSPTVKTTESGGVRGYDGGQKASERKRPFVVDPRGLLRADTVGVTPPMVQNCTLRAAGDGFRG